MSISFKNKKIIIFDLDGTIVNLTADWMSLKDTLAEKYREHYNEDCDFIRISACLDEIVQKNDDDVLKDFFDVIREYELKNIKDTQLIEETIFFINNCELFGAKKEVKFAILSLNTRSTIIRALELANITDKIDFIIGREDVRRWKPAPDGILKIKNHYHVTKREMIFFGDLEKDISTGKNAGIDAYIIDDLIEYIKEKIRKISRN
ncbi:MAG: HAD family hydrolase [Promethearchaeota archaeon]